MPGTHTIKQTAGKFLNRILPFNEEAVNILRVEINAFMVRMGCYLNPYKISKISRARKQEDVSLNIGAGPFGEIGWVNIDLFKYKNITFTYDCRKHLPFKDQSVIRIRCEHFLEHLDRRSEADNLLRNCYKCLKSGGILRIVVPHTPRYLEAYVKNTAEAWATLDVTLPEFSEHWLPMDVLNHIFRQGGEHKFAYDVDTMKISLREAGFSNIMVSEYGQSIDTLLRKDLVNHRYRSLYFDCVK